MKIKVSQKQIREGYDKILIVGYCDLPFLLKGQEPRYYTCGVYGWNSDVYHIDNRVAICTGYRPIGNVRTNDKGLNIKYNDKARKIYEDYDIPYQKRIDKINKLLEKYIEEVLKDE